MAGTARRFRRVAYLGPEIAEDSSEFEKERAARRRLVALTGKCPCGAELRLPVEPPAPGMVMLVAVEHEPDCPAVEDR